ncbi:hypothetical protein RYX36_014781, partial [Vicia faba]
LYVLSLGTAVMIPSFLVPLMGGTDGDKVRLYVLSLGTAVMIPSFLVPLMGGTDGDKVRVIQILLFLYEELIHFYKHSLQLTISKFDLQT